jgi:ATP-dependent DNA ligase
LGLLDRSGPRRSAHSYVYQGVPSARARSDCGGRAGGYRTHKTDANAVGSLLLGLYKDDGTLASVGVIGAFPTATRRRLFTELHSLVTTFEEHPWNWAAHMAGDRTPRRSEDSRWNAGKDLSFVPLRPERVVEVRYDHMEGERFRHTAQFNRWRPDRDPRSCTYAQLEQPVTFSLSDIVPGLGIAISR